MDERHGGCAGGAKMTLNKVLIPLDGSPFGEQILPIVRRYLRPEENELVLFQVAELPDVGTGGLADLVADTALHDRVVERISATTLNQAMHPIYTSQIEEGVAVSRQQKLMPLVHKLSSAGYTVSAEIGFGNPAQAIERYVRYHEVDLVAMTTHGRSGLRRALVGSVAEYLLRHLAVPILILHPSDKDRDG
jgi:nucleotide-binding universal stress UspA family protein